MGILNAVCVGGVELQFHTFHVHMTNRNNDRIINFTKTSVVDIYGECKTDTLLMHYMTKSAQGSTLNTYK